MASVLPSHAELRSTQEELTVLAESFTRIQDRLSNIIRKSEDEALSLQERLKDLESEGRDMDRELKGVWSLNQELQKSTNTHDPELRKAVDARNAAIRKTHHAWKVIRDLMEEKGIGLGTDVGASSTSDFTGRGQRQRMVSSPEAMADGSNTSETGSDKTVRPRRRTASEVIRQGEKSGSPGRAIGSRRGTPVVEEGGSTSRESGDTSSSGGTWSIRYSQKPLSSLLAVGPLSWAAVAERLKLDEDMIRDFEGLADIQTLGMRIQILKDANVAFVHDPIMLQGTSHSYLIDWGERNRNAAAKTYIKKNDENGDPILHTFLFPAKKDAWYYVGAMSWKPVDIGWTVWPTLSAKSRSGLVSKLKSRCGEDLTKDDIVTMMDEGMLNELVVQIDGRPDVFKESSRAFARETLGSKQPSALSQ